MSDEQAPEPPPDFTMTTNLEVILPGAIQPTAVDERIPVYLGDADDPDRKLVGTATIDENGMADIRIPDPDIESIVAEEGHLAVTFEDGEQVAVLHQPPTEVPVQALRLGDIIEATQAGVTVTGPVFVHKQEEDVHARSVYLGDHSIALILDSTWTYKLITPAPKEEDSATDAG